MSHVPTMVIGDNPELQLKKFSLYHTDIILNFLYDYWELYDDNGFFDPEFRYPFFKLEYQLLYKNKRLVCHFLLGLIDIEKTLLIPPHDFILNGLYHSKLEHTTWCKLNPRRTLIKTYTDLLWKQLYIDIFKLLSPDTLISMYSTHQVFG